jgi:rare lipoprotein A
MAYHWMKPCVLAMLALTLLLAGCAGHKASTGGAAGQGVYKVGKPYQIAGTWYYPAVDYDYSETGIASWYGPDFHGKDTANGEPYDMNELTAAHRTLPMPSMVRVTNLENGRQIALRVNDRGPFARNRIIDVSRRAAQLLGFEQQGTARVRVDIMAAESRQIALLAGAGTPAPPASAIPTTVASSGTAPAQPAAAAPALAAPTARLETEALPPPPGASAAAPAPVASKPAPQVLAQRPPAAEPEPDGKVFIVPVRQTAMFIQAGAFTNIANASRLRAQLAALGPSRVVPAVIGNQQFYRVRLGPIASLAAADQMLDRVVSAGHPEARLIVD